MRVDGEEGAFEVVGADHDEGALDDLAVAGFALAEGGLGGALGGDVDACGDDEADLSLGVPESGGGPGDAAEAAVAVEPLIFKDSGKGSGAEAFEGVDGLGDLVAGGGLVPGGAGGEGGGGIGGGPLAGGGGGERAGGGGGDGGGGGRGGAGAGGEQ